MTNFLLFLVAAALGLWVLNRGAPWDKTVQRRDETLDLTGHRWGDREQRS
jgi:hypothetical protein